jgi:hypothetical protein
VNEDKQLKGWWHADAHLGDGLRGREPGLLLGLLGDRLVDPLLGFFVELGHA